MNVLRRIREAVQAQQYRISAHANDEMADDSLTSEDIERIIFTGAIVRKFTHDPRGTRYEVRGETVDRRWAYVVCRFSLSGVVLIITAYAEDLETGESENNA